MYIFIHNLCTIDIRSCSFLYGVNMSKKNIDRGQLLKTMVEESGISISSLVKKLGYKDRGSYYAHIRKPDLSFDILSNYAKVLKYDLKRDFPEASFLVEEPAGQYFLTPENMDEALDLIEKWKRRYYMLMDKYVELIEERKKN